MMGSDILINFNIGVDSMDSSSGTKGGLRHVASCLDVKNTNSVVSDKLKVLRNCLLNELMQDIY